MKQLLILLLTCIVPSLVSADIKVNGVCIKEWNGVQVTQWNEVNVSCDDTIPPAIVSMTVSNSGTDVAVALTEEATAGTDGFTSLTIYYSDYFEGELPLVTLTYASGGGTNTLHFMPSSPVPSDAHLVGSIGPISRGEYIQPGDGIKDNAGNLLTTNGSITVTNNSTQ